MTEQVKKLGTFLCDYATSLLECGSTTIRIEKNVCRMAEAYGNKAEVSIYSRHVEVVLTDSLAGEKPFFSKAVRHSGINYHAISELSRLSWNCFDRRLPLDVAIAQYEGIIAAPRIPFVVVMLLASLANASFCRLFEGDLPSMMIVFAATLCGFCLKDALCRKWHVDLRISVMIAAFVSAVLSCSGYVFDWGDTPDVALATSVLYLVPGIPYLNAVSDLVNGHCVCSMSRLLYAVIVTVCLSVGLYFGLVLMDINIVR